MDGRGQLVNVVGRTDTSGPPRSTKARLLRAHGLGNDYLVWEGGSPLSASLVRSICDRHRGVGADGVLEPADPGPADHGVRIWNPDGSVAEKSGNGLRIFARWLFDRGAGTQFTIWTGSDRVSCDLGDPGRPRIAMGRATLRPQDVPVLAEVPVLDAVLDDLPRLTAIGIGNPHAVTFSDAARENWRTLGPIIENHPRFPRRTNVQFARMIDARSLSIAIWERGAGPTMASGSSSCAAAVAAVVTGRTTPGLLQVHMEGGDVEVTVSPDLDVELQGDVELVGTFELDPSWLDARAAR